MQKESHLKELKVAAILAAEVSSVEQNPKAAFEESYNTKFSVTIRMYSVTMEKPTTIEHLLVSSCIDNESKMASRPGRHR